MKYKVNAAVVRYPIYSYFFPSSAETITGVKGLNGSSLNSAPVTSKSYMILRTVFVVIHPKRNLTASVLTVEKVFLSL